jgi:hypothetical protein
MMNQPPMPAGAQQQQMPSQEEIMMAGMIALGLIDPQNMQPGAQPGAPAPAPAQPMPQDDSRARIAAQLMK